MPQTIAAIFALGAAVLLAFNMQQASVKTQMDLVHEEVTSFASSVALDVLGHIGAQDFDSATRGATVTDPANLSSTPFSTGNRYENADDIDDFHRMQTYTFISDYDGMPFDVDVTVDYVDEADGTTVVAGPTFAKLVTVTVSNDLLRERDVDIVLSQVYTYP
ncbi:MAG: hypothetical protein AAGG50_21370 [Bacteroidota bacterium]